MHEEHLKKILERLETGALSSSQALEQLRHLPLEELSQARLDHHRGVRTGIPEVVFGEGKTTDQLVEILSAMLTKPSVVLATRVSRKKAKAVCRQVQGLTYHSEAAMLTGNDRYIPTNCAKGRVLIVTAGTSDICVAEEARISLAFFGHPTHRLYDAGIAGLHRITAHYRLLQEAVAIIVVAGMEGALPGVVAGMTAAPVIAVPTSIGYGAGAGGISALLGMLNSCAPGLAVVNIDNGFGAACMAAAINRKL